MMRTAGARRRYARHIFAQNQPLVSELVGRTAPPMVVHPFVGISSVDRTQPDAKWWSHFRRGKASGYELAAVFAQPAINIMTAWTLGDKFAPLSENETADGRLSEFVDDEFDTILTWFMDGLGLGNAYLIVNPDGSLSMPSPETVEIVTDDFNYKEVIAVRVTTQLEKVIIIDEYRADSRSVTIRSAATMAFGQNGSAATPLTETTFDFVNPLGVIPVIHWGWGKEANEIYGHPVYEALLKVFTRYHDSLDKSLDGIEVMGRPVPVVEGAEDPESVKELNKTNDEQVVDREGNLKTRPVIEMEAIEMLVLGKGASFKFASPGAFAQDSRMMLKVLFLLTLEHLNIPEFVWGGAIASSKASADAQMPAFTRIVQLWRAMIEKPLLKLLDIWLRTVSAYEFLPAAGRIQIEWPDVVSEDEGLMIEKIMGKSHSGALGNELITSETALRILNLVDDPAAEVEAAQKEAEERRDAFDQTIDALNNAEDNPDGDGNTDDSEESAA